VEKKKAKRITIIYGVIAFIAMSFVLFALGMGAAGAAIIFWSWVNYKILTYGIVGMSLSEFAELQRYMDESKKNTEYL
jgi:hypothetical protein